MRVSEPRTERVERLGDDGMSGIGTFTKNAMITDGLNPVATNTPTQYGDRQKQYFDAETRAFILRNAKYSSDFVEAEVQGIDGDFSKWPKYRLRFADVVRPTAAIQRHFDDYKIVLFESPKVEYIQPGTKIRTMGNIWLATNPINVSGASGSGVVRRCNAVWNHLDYYGNVVSEPMVVENERANANDSDAQISQLITKGYFNVTCQYNDDTRQIDTNTRMILGTGAYRVTGYSDFESEFTGDYSTVRLLSFTVRYEEPNDAIDDMENHVAGGKTFSWVVSALGPASLSVGTTAQLTAKSVRNGETVVSTAENPISYEWESSDESVITVDGDGNVTAVGEGSATIRVKVAQNTELHENFPITVTETADGVEFTTIPPKSLGAYESAAVSAAYFVDGDEQADALTWAFTGADETAYSATVAADGKSAEIGCYGYSATPLTVTASYGTYSASAEIQLQGI